mgnify:CR=1 FL=1
MKQIIFCLLLILALIACKKQPPVPAQCSTVITCIQQPTGGYSVLTDAGTYFSMIEFKPGMQFCR